MILSAVQAFRPVSVESGDLAATVVGCDLVEVCKRAAAKFCIAWPVTPGDPGVIKWDIHEGKSLPFCLPPEKQLLPTLLACVAEMKQSWENPFLIVCPSKATSRLM